jgi:general secretion pathway protein L
MNLQAMLPRVLMRRDGVDSLLRRFWTWWSTELLYFVPPAIRDAFDKQERVLLVSVRDNELLVDYRHGDEHHRADRISLLDGPVRDAESESAIPETDRVIVNLSVAQAARRQVSLPIGAEDRLGDVLVFEMDRLTPFSAADIYYDYRVVNRDPAHGTITVDLVIALRKTIDDLLGRLAQRNIEVSQLTLVGAAASTNLLPKDRRASVGPKLPIIPTVLTGVAAILAIIAIAYPLAMQRVEISQLEREVGELRPTALAADEIRAKIAAAAQQSDFFTERWNRAPTKIQMLNELARLIPDDTWLTRIEVNGETVRIHGESEGASSLIGLIEESRLLQDPQFSSPVTKNPRTRNDRFVIEALVESGEGAQ